MVDYASKSLGKRASYVGPFTGLGSLIWTPLLWFIPFLLLSVVVGLFMIPFGGGWVFSPLMAAFFVYSLRRAMMARRRHNGEMIVSYVETAVRLNLPLVAFLGAAARSEKGRCRQQLEFLTTLLSSGIPVGSALLEIEDVPADSAARISAAESLGQLRQGLARSVEKQRENDNDRNDGREKQFSVFYPLFLIYVALMIGMGFMVFIAPKMREIFKDFKTTPPLVTQSYFAVAAFLLEDWWPVTLCAGLLIFAIAAMTVSAYLNQMFLPKVRMPAFGRWVEYLAWRIPVLHRLERDRGMTEVCELFAEALRNGLPLPVAIARTQMLPVNRGLKKQLAKFQEGMEEGMPLAEAARKAQMPRLLTDMLSPMSVAPVGASAADMFGFLARYYRQRFSRTTTAIKAAVEPAVVLVMGAVVLWTSLALFLPLVKLVQSVTPGLVEGAL